MFKYYRKRLKYVRWLGGLTVLSVLVSSLNAIDAKPWSSQTPPGAMTPTPEYSTAIATINDPLLLPHAVSVTPLLNKTAQSTLSPTGLADNTPAVVTTAIATINDPALLPRALSATPLANQNPQAATANLSVNSGTVTVATTAIATISDPALLPHAMSATPLPQSPTPVPATLPPTANPANQALLNQAVTNTFSANFVRFALSVDMPLTIAGESGEIQIKSVGFMTHLSTLQNFTMQNTTNVNLVDQTGQQNYLIEERVVKGILYLRGENPQRNLQTHWIAIPLVTLLQNTFFIPISQGIFGGGKDSPVLNIAPDALQPILNLMDISQFIVTKRLDQGQAVARFQSVVELDQLLHSSKNLTALLEAIQSTGHLAISASQIDSAVKLIQTAGRLIVPHIELTIGTQIDAQQKVLTLVTVDFNGDFNLGDLTKLQFQPLQMQVNATLSLSGYGSTVPSVVEVPADAIVVSDLNTIPRDQVLLPLATTTPGPTVTSTIGPTETAISITPTP